MTTDLIIVTGCMRSGTSVLMSVICAAPETNDLVAECQYVTSQLATYRRELHPDRQRFLRDYFDDKPGLKAFTSRILDDFLSMTRERLGNPPVLALKNPELALFFPEAAALLPAAKFLISVRDPRDIITSIMDVAERQAAQGGRSDLTAAGRDMKKLSDLVKTYYAPILTSGLSNGRIAFVRYENLITRTERTVAEMADFCGISLGNYDPDREWTYAFPPTHKTPFHTDLMGKPLSNDSIGRHRAVLTADEIGQIDRHCAELYAKFGYSPEGPEPPVRLEGAD
jgi:sulfotransferase family protein